MKNQVLAVIMTGMLAGPAGALASITITQGSSAPTYSTTLDFDEAGGPTGAVSTDAWQSIGISELQAGDGAPFVDDFGIGDGNAFFGNFGVFLTFDSDVTEMSLQVFDPSGPPSPFGGGLGIFLFDDGAEVASFSATPAWAGFGDEWFDIVASAGSVFDEVRILGFGFGPTTYVDSLSWNTAPVPAPGALLLLASGLAGLGFSKRRKSA